MSQYPWRSLLLWLSLVILGRSAKGYPSQSISDHHWNSDHPWLWRDGQRKAHPFRVSLPVPGCPGKVSQRGTPDSHCNSDCPWLSQDCQPQAPLSEYLWYHHCNSEYPRLSWDGQPKGTDRERGHVSSACILPNPTQTSAWAPHNINGIHRWPHPLIYELYLSTWGIKGNPHTVWN